MRSSVLRKGFVNKKFMPGQISDIGLVLIWFERFLYYWEVGPRGGLWILRYMFFQGSKNWLYAVRSCSIYRIWLFLRLRIIAIFGFGRKLYIRFSCLV